MDTDSDDDLPVPRRGSELPPKNLDRVRALADSLDCVLDDDLQALSGCKQSTTDAWAKRGTGPDYVILGNRRLYPRDALRKFLKERLRERTRHMNPRGPL